MIGGHAPPHGPVPPRQSRVRQGNLLEPLPNLTG